MPQRPYRSDLVSCSNDGWTWFVLPTPFPTDSTTVSCMKCGTQLSDDDAKKVLSEVNS